MGTSCIRLGKLCVMAFSSAIGSSPDNGLIIRLFMTWHCLVGLGPSTVIVEKACGIQSASFIPRSLTTFEYTNEDVAWSSIMARPSTERPVFV